VSRRHYDNPAAGLMVIAALALSAIGMVALIVKIVGALV
jgi:hypothetical protein